MRIIVTFKNPQVDSAVACHQGLGITALGTVMSLRDKRINADALPVTNGEHLWKHLDSSWSDATHVVLSAPFIDARFLRGLFNNFSSKRFALIYHSNLGFLSQDRFAGASLPLYVALESSCRNFTLAGNSSELSTAIQAATGQPFACLPNMYHLPHIVRQARDRWRPGAVIDIGLFGAARVLKNWLTAGAAAMIMSRTLASDVRLHISSGRDEGSAATRDNLLSLLSLNQRVKLVDAPWLGHDDFRRYVSGMDLLLQPSFTETFNNVTADGCSLGVPSVVSEAIDWAPPEWIAKADSAVQVAKVGCALLRDRRAAMRGWKALDKHNANAMKAWIGWINPRINPT